MAFPNLKGVHRAQESPAPGHHANLLRCRFLAKNLCDRVIHHLDAVKFRRYSWHDPDYTIKTIARSNPPFHLQFGIL